MGRGAAAAGFTVVELLVVLAVLSLLTAVILPAVQQVREASRQAECVNHLHQLGIATQEHESRRRRFPYTYGGAYTGAPKEQAGRTAPSPHAFLMASLDVSVFRQIDWDDWHSLATGRRLPHSNSPANRELLRQVIPVLLCPSDRVVPGGTSYRANVGSGPGLFPLSARPRCPDPSNGLGAYVHGRAVSPAEFLDGLSHTVMMSEKTLGDGVVDEFDPQRDRIFVSAQICSVEDAIRVASAPIPVPFEHDSFHGYAWLYGGLNLTWYNHVAGPNSVLPDVSSGGYAATGGQGLYTTRSRHPGLVNSLYADGAVKQVSDNIDERVWRSLGTRAEPSVRD